MIACFQHGCKKRQALGGWPRGTQCLGHLGYRLSSPPGGQNFKKIYIKVENFKLNKRNGGGFTQMLQVSVARPLVGLVEKSELQSSLLLLEDGGWRQFPLYKYIYIQTFKWVRALKQLCAGHLSGAFKLSSSQ